jgi:hypothetical protein
LEQYAIGCHSHRDVLGCPVAFGEAKGSRILPHQRGKEGSKTREWNDQRKDIQWSCGTRTCGRRCGPSDKRIGVSPQRAGQSFLNLTMRRKYRTTAATEFNQLCRKLQLYGAKPSRLAGSVSIDPFPRCRYLVDERHFPSFAHACSKCCVDSHVIPYTYVNNRGTKKSLK